MARPEDVSLVVEKIQKGFELGDQCSGMAWGKSVPEWKEIFNEASASLRIPVVEVGPLKGGTRQDMIDQVTDFARAFQQTAGKPAVILADATGNELQKDPTANWQVANQIERLVKKFPKAVYVQVIPQASGGDSPLQIYCMNPKKPRDPSQPIYPV